MADCLSRDPKICLYNDPTTSCSYYSGETNFTRIPESTLVSINSSTTCIWVEGILTRLYTTQDVWRDLLPATIYNPNSTNCYGEQYLDYFNLSSADDRDYSRSRNWLIPRGLAALTDSCPDKCPGTGTTGNPDMAGPGMLVAYAFELFFITVLYLSQLTGLGAKGSRAYSSVFQCSALAAHKGCTGGVVRECSAAVAHGERCNVLHERWQPATETRRHGRAMEETTASFLDAAIFFALSVAIGSIGGSLSQGISKYEQRVMSHISRLAVSSLYTVLAFSSKTLRRKYLRRNLTSLAVILLGPGLLGPLSEAYRRRERWDVICFGSNYASLSVRDLVDYCIRATVVILELCRLLFWPIKVAAKSYMPNSEFLIEMSAEKPWGQRTSRSFWQRALGFFKRYIYNWESQKASVWVVATCGFAVASFAGGSFAYEKVKIQSVTGGDYIEWEMAYGQYLAAVIWLPVVVEYVYAWTVGATEASEGRLSTHYTIARPAESQHCPAAMAGAGGPGEVGGRGSEGFELEQTHSARDILPVHSEPTPTTQALTGGVPERRRARPV